MVSVPGVNRKTYAEHFGRGQRLPELACPDPSCHGCTLRGHGYYQRYVDTLYMELRRVRGSKCKITHIVQPEDMCAFRDLSFPVLEEALSTPGGPSVRAYACGQLGEVGRRRVRGWLRALSRGLTGAVGFFPAVVGGLWERVQAVFGEKPGALVRLRRWLVSAHRYFLGGLCGLFRFGRPRPDLHGASTQIGTAATDSG
jgi:hypothetical protein